MSRRRTVRYAKVPVTVSDRLRGLPPEAVAAYFLILTAESRTTAPGVMRANVAMLQPMLGAGPWFAGAVQILKRKNLVLVDEDERVVLIPHHVQDDPPANASVCRGYVRVLSELPSCAVTRLAARLLREAVKHAGWSDEPFQINATASTPTLDDLLAEAEFDDDAEARGQGVGDGVPHGGVLHLQLHSPSQEQEQEQEQTPSSREARKAVRLLEDEGRAAGGEKTKPRGRTP